MPSRPTLLSGTTSQRASKATGSRQYSGNASNDRLEPRSHSTNLKGPVPTMWVSMYWLGSPGTTPPLASTASWLTMAAVGVYTTPARNQPAGSFR